MIRFQLDLLRFKESYRTFVEIISIKKKKNMLRVIRKLNLGKIVENKTISPEIFGLIRFFDRFLHSAYIVFFISKITALVFRKWKNDIKDFFYQVKISILGFKKGKLKLLETWK